MQIKLNSAIIERFVRRREELYLTQNELADKAKIGRRTLIDIESGRRTSFNESTMIPLCKALNLEFNELFGQDGIYGKRMVIWAASIILLGLVVFVYFSEFARKDWIDPEQKLKVSHFNPNWSEKENGINVNYYHLDRVVFPGDTIQVEFKWSYHFCEGSTPMYYINAFTEWEPDSSIDIFEGVLHGKNSDTLCFEFLSPELPDMYKIRVFFASALGAVPSYFGAPQPNQLSQPICAPYIEIPIEVIEK